MDEGFRVNINMDGNNKRIDETSESSSSFYGESDDSMFSSSSDMSDDESSSTPSPENSRNVFNEEKQDCRGSLFELSTLKDELPIKRGLSKYYQGKSQSFKLLSEARCLQDLVKKQISSPYRKRIITSKSYTGGLDSTKNSKPLFAPGLYNKTIAKKGSRSTSCASNLLARKISSNSLLSCSKLF